MVPEALTRPLPQGPGQRQHGECAGARFIRTVHAVVVELRRERAVVVGDLSCGISVDDCVDATAASELVDEYLGRCCNTRSTARCVARSCVFCTS